jgi:hypothetical protein
MPGEALQGEARADALFERFQCLFDTRQYQASLPVLDEACQLRDTPRCLYNLALVHHSLFHCELAVRYYEAYLMRDPYDPAREQALSSLTELRGFCGAPESEPLSPPASLGILPLGENAGAAAPARAAALAPVPQALLPDSGSPRRVLAFATLGAGAATAIATAVFAVYGQRAESDVVERAERTQKQKDAEAEALEHNGHRYNTLAWVFLGSSVALLGTSATLFYLDAKATQSVSVSSEGAFSVRYRGSF